MRYFVVDAFTDEPFHGNPAGVCLMDAFPSDAVMQAIAAQNNLSETAFAVPTGDVVALRWFTPAAEVDLCGHATLGTAAVWFEEGLGSGDTVTFETRSGALTVTREDRRLTMDFPRNDPRPLPITAAMCRAVGEAGIVAAAAGGDDLLLELVDEAAVRTLVPDMAAIGALEFRGVIVTARGDDCDMVSRFFGPRVGVPEDPVTGSAHTALTPYWAAKLGKDSLVARQVSQRGGTVWCSLAGNRVRIAGRARRYLTGEIAV
ncbi:MAG: PhzF family phenazine biosynthesis protein [Actinomycetia bacterium]|nr:PhzF family phenazine biosynthesis protein [Actinomycetes bacterium]